MRRSNRQEPALAGDDVHIWLPQGHGATDKTRSRLRSDPGARWPSDPQRYSYMRWAEIVGAVISAAEDPRTVDLWGHHVAKSPAALRNVCSRIRLSALHSLFLARALRALVLSKRFGDRPEDYLDIIDSRTLGKFLRVGGLDSRDIPDVTVFLEIQLFIADEQAIRALRARVIEESKSW
jgi:hypothetical protein